MYACSYAVSVHCVAHNNRLNSYDSHYTCIQATHNLCGHPFLLLAIFVWKKFTVLY